MSRTYTEDEFQAAVRNYERTYHYAVWELARCSDCGRVHRSSLRNCPSCTSRHAEPLTVTTAAARAWHKHLEAGRRRIEDGIIARINRGVAA